MEQPQITTATAAPIPTWFPSEEFIKNTKLNHDHYEIYYAGMPKTADGIVLRRHGDQIRQFANGFYRALGRVDDTMNLGGIKSSAAEIERTLLLSELINETAAIAIPPNGGGPRTASNKIMRRVLRDQY